MYKTFNATIKRSVYYNNCILRKQKIYKRTISVTSPKTLTILKKKKKKKTFKPRVEG